MNRLVVIAALVGALSGCGPEQPTPVSSTEGARGTTTDAPTAASTPVVESVVPTSKVPVVKPVETRRATRPAGTSMKAPEPARKTQTPRSLARNSSERRSAIRSDRDPRSRATTSTTRTERTKAETKAKAKTETEVSVETTEARQCPDGQVLTSNNRCIDGTTPSE